jgi:branched-subunit amino acid aminotransferase/4-amino-4-deoxychorismate lyase
MVNYSLKKSYQLKDLKEIKFKDLWGGHGVFTTMWVFDNPIKILFFKEHINNLIKSSRAYSITKTSLKSDILKLIKENLNSKTKYNHLLRIAVNKKILSISLRKRIKPNLNFELKLVNLKRQKPEFKNLKYKEILKHLSKIDNSVTDIGLCSNNKIFETGTSNLLFIKNNKIFSPISKFYKGITYKFFKSKVNKIINKNIMINTLSEFNEIVLIGSGKGVASVKTIDDIGWQRQSLKVYNLLKRFYLQALKNYPKYK